MVKCFFHVYIDCGYLLNSHLNFSGTQKPAPCSGLGAATSTCEEPEEADEGVAEHPIHTIPHTQTLGGLPGLGLDPLPPDTIDEGSLLYKLGKQGCILILLFSLVISESSKSEGEDRCDLSTQFDEICPD